MAISDKLQELLDIKQDIKEALENKGVDLTGGGSQGETWLINKTLNYENFQASNISFTSNGRSYTSLSRVYAPEGNPPYKVLKYGWTNVYYDDEGWSNEAYRTITFETPPTGDLLTWLETNAVNITAGVAFSGYAEKIDELPAVVELTQAQYDALSVYDDNTYYLIVEE